MFKEWANKKNNTTLQYTEVSKADDGRTRCGWFCPKDQNYPPLFRGNWNIEQQYEIEEAVIHAIQEDLTRLVNCNV